MKNGLKQMKTKPTTTTTKKKVEKKCVCGCGADLIISPFSEDDYQTVAEPYPYDYE